MPQHGGDARLLRPIHTVAGGSGLNTATHLSSLLHNFWERSDDDDTWNASLQTVINERDEYGMMISSHCSRHGFSLVNRRMTMMRDNDDGNDKSTGHCAVIVSNGDRSFMTYLGCMEDFRGSHVLINDSKKYSCIDNVVHHRQHVHIAGYYNIAGFWDGELASKLAEIREDEAKKNEHRSKITISLVPQQDATEKWDGGLLELLHYIDFLILSEVEARNITRYQSTATMRDTNDHTDFLQHVTEFAPFANSNTRIIVTLQSKGAVAIYDGNIVHRQTTSPEIDNPIDPTGAGDAFAAGFLYGYLSYHHRGERGGGGDNDKEAVIDGMRWGCATGTTSVMIQGASVPPEKECIERTLDCITHHSHES